MRAKLLAVLSLVLVLAIVGLIALRPRGSAPSPEQQAAAASIRARVAMVSAASPRTPLEGAQAAAAEERAGHGALAWDALAAAAAGGDPEAELRLAIFALRVPVPDRMSQDEALGLVAVVGAESPGARLLPAARAWAMLAADKPVEALRLAELDAAAPKGATLEGALARLRAAMALGQPALEPATAILALDPSNGEACAASSRAALADGDLSTLLARARSCVDAGATDPSLARALGDGLDAAGRFGEAYQIYGRASLSLHAGAIALQEGIDDPLGMVDRALADPAPPAALFKVWAGLLRGDSALAADGARSLADAGFPGPEAVVARAASAIVAGDPAAAVRLLGELSSPSAAVLSARAHALIGDQDGAAAAFGEALRGAPSVPAVHRERLAWLADAPRARRLAGAEALAEVDPLSLALGAASRSRDAPWAAVAPSPWPALPLDTPEGALLLRVLDPLGAPEPAAALSPADQALANLHRAYALARSGATAEGATLAAAAAEASPGRAGGALVAAELARASGDPAGAQAWLQRAEASLAEDAPERPALGWVRARLLLDAGDRDGAIAALSAAARACPDCVLLWGALLSLQEGGTIPELEPARLTAAPRSTR